VAAREEQRRRPVAVLSGIGRSLAPAAVAAAVAVSALVTFRPGALDLSNRPAVPPIVAQSPAGEPVLPPAVVGPVDSIHPPMPPIGVPPSARQPRFDLVGDGLSNKMTDPIARFYSGNQQVRDLLGAASPGSRTVTLLEQSFQGGLAIWRSDTREIYVLRRDGQTWSEHPDTWRPGDAIAVDVLPPPGALIPAAGFGTVWRSTPEIQSRLGWAVYEPRGSGGSIQTYEHGMVVWTPHGLIYVLSNDGRWRTYPDATSL